MSATLMTHRHVRACVSLLGPVVRELVWDIGGMGSRFCYLSDHFWEQNLDFAFGSLPPTQLEHMPSIWHMGAPPQWAMGECHFVGLLFCVSPSCCLDVCGSPHDKFELGNMLRLKHTFIWYLELYGLCLCHKPPLGLHCQQIFPPSLFLMHL